MIETIIFDLDGTLLNTLKDLTISVNFALARFKCPPRTKDEIRSFVGEGVSTLLLRALPEGKKQLRDDCLKVFEEHYNKNKTHFTRPYRGINKMLKKVVKAGYKTAIVSNKYDEAVRELKNKEFPCIDITVGERKGIPKKPAPDMVMLALNELNEIRDNAVYVGDSDIDIMTARNCGLPVIAVTWGFRDRMLLESMGADVIIDNPKEFLNAVKRLGVI